VFLCVCVCVYLFGFLSRVFPSGILSFFFFFVVDLRFSCLLHPHNTHCWFSVGMVTNSFLPLCVVLLVACVAVFCVLLCLDLFFC